MAKVLNKAKMYCVEMLNWYFLFFNKGVLRVLSCCRGFDFHLKQIFVAIFRVKLMYLKHRNNTRCFYVKTATSFIFNVVQ